VTRRVPASGRRGAPAPAAPPLGTAEFDPSDPALVDNPYPTYARLRREAPVLYLPGHDVWIVSRYADVTSVLRDPATFSSAVGMSPDFGAGTGAATGIGYRFGGPDVRVLISMDPPDHLVFRRAVAGLFTPSSVAAAHGRAHALAAECVADLVRNAGSGQADFCADVAGPLPVLMLADLFGVPAAMRGEFRAWASVMSADLSRGGQPDDVGRGMAMFRYFDSELRKARNQPQRTLFGAIAAAQGKGPTHRELLAFCAFLLAAGLETTTNLLTNLLAALFEFPAVQERLRERPELIDDAVEEALRYDTSIQGLWRGTTRPVELGGQHIPASARMMVLFGSANRDERQFADPGRFLLGRDGNPHVGFGAGPHYCLGARLARLEVAAALRALLAATSWIEPAGDPERIDSVVLRGLTRQPVRVHPR
jgi:cytochrome P450